MKKLLYITAISLLLAEAPLSVAVAANADSPDYNPDHPFTNQLNPAPDDPDQVYGSSSDIHKVPAAVPQKDKTIVYDPTTTRIDNKDEPSAPSNTDVNTPNSGNSGITIPAPSSGNKGSR